MKWHTLKNVLISPWKFMYSYAHFYYTFDAVCKCPGHQVLSIVNLWQQCIFPCISNFCFTEIPVVSKFSITWIRDYTQFIHITIVRIFTEKHSGRVFVLSVFFFLLYSIVLTFFYLSVFHNLTKKNLYIKWCFSPDVVDFLYAVYRYRNENIVFLLLCYNILFDLFFLPHCSYNSYKGNSHI